MTLQVRTDRENLTCWWSWLSLAVKDLSAGRRHVLKEKGDQRIPSLGRRRVSLACNDAEEFVTVRTRLLDITL